MSTSLTSAAAAVAVLPPWEAIDTVLLDMDGTLLDLRFDNYFWLEFLPERYAERHQLTLEKARTVLRSMLLSKQGTLDWYCTDFWTRELSLDIAGMKREIREHVRFLPGADGWSTMAGGIVLGLLFFAAAAAVGSYLGARRELVTSLHERVRIAQLEQALATTVAREAERNRIAREMHDVMAHRISLVALHAGALAYREDLSRAQTAETAGTIQANAQLALAELRQVLGVLRAGPAPPRAEPPQPTLAELPALLADAREAGSVVELDSSGLPAVGELSDSLSRTSFRILQEALTNARKHAGSHATADVRLRYLPDAVELEVTDDGLGARRGGPRAGSGLGLIGMRERVSADGGTVLAAPRSRGGFVVRAHVPLQGHGRRDGDGGHV